MKFADSSEVALALGWGYAVVTGWRPLTWRNVDLLYSRRRSMQDRLGLKPQLLQTARAAQALSQSLTFRQQPTGRPQVRPAPLSAAGPSGQSQWTRRWTPSAAADARPPSCSRPGLPAGSEREHAAVLMPCWPRTTQRTRTRIFSTTRRPDEEMNSEQRGCCFPQVHPVGRSPGPGDRRGLDELAGDTACVRPCTPYFPHRL